MNQGCTALGQVHSLVSGLDMCSSLRNCCPHFVQVSPTSRAEQHPISCSLVHSSYNRSCGTFGLSSVPLERTLMYSVQACTELARDNVRHGSLAACCSILLQRLVHHDDRLAHKVFHDIHMRVFFFFWLACSLSTDALLAHSLLADIAPDS